MAHVSYSISLVTYIDILGFKDLIATRSAGDISRIIRIFKETLRPARHKTRLKALPDDEFVNFSDLIVIATPLEKARVAPGLQLFSQLMRLMFAQSSLMADEGIAIRGAITIGQVVKSWRQIYGPAVVRAYELERDQAKYPRIVIDDLIFKTLHGIPHAWHNGESADRRYLREITRRDDKDGMLFVEYLKGLRGEFDDPAVYPDFLRKHRTFIDQKLQMFAGQASIQRKYRWLDRYHKTTLRFLQGARSDSEPRTCAPHKIGACGLSEWSLENRETFTYTYTVSRSKNNNTLVFNMM